MYCVLRSAPVSILSQPEGRELPGLSHQPKRVSRVSILSQPEGRELPAANVAATGQVSFNPLPARRPGATSADAGQRLAQVFVSILSQPEGRELLVAAYG